MEQYMSQNIHRAERGWVNGKIKRARTSQGDATTSFLPFPEKNTGTWRSASGVLYQLLLLL
jgi:hypothetical protein